MFTNKRTVLQINLAYPWRTVGNKVTVPVTLMTQGVRMGSLGAILWKSDILSDNPSRWNGVPVVINHPQVNGEFVSVYYNPKTIAEIVGYVRNAKFDGQLKALKADIEVNLSSKELPKLQLIKEVSIGVFSEMKEETGIWNRQSYYAIVTRYIPDHLALLSNEKGACSWEDGCGIRVNQNFNLINKQEVVMSNYGLREEEILFPLEVNQTMKKQSEQEVNADEFDEDILYPPNVYQAMKKNAKSKPIKSNGDELDEEDILYPSIVKR